MRNFEQLLLDNNSWFVVAIVGSHLREEALLVDVLEGSRMRVRNLLRNTGIAQGYYSSFAGRLVPATFSALPIAMSVRAGLVEDVDVPVVAALLSPLASSVEGEWGENIVRVAFLLGDDRNKGRKRRCSFLFLVVRRRVL